MKDLNFILTAEEPWIVVLKDYPKDILERIQSYQSKNPGLKVIVLDGQSMTTLDDYYDELTRKLDLPEYFGRNADALDECLSDLSWINFTAMVLLIKDSRYMLSKENQLEKCQFLDILWNIGMEWSLSNLHEENIDHSSIPFHTILIQEDVDSLPLCGFRYEIPLLDL
jgi:RNAse (barnase) inhibitor barstar